MGFGKKVLTCKEGVENSDSIEVKLILVCAQVLEKLREFLARGKGPQFLFPDGDPLTHFLIRSVRVLESWTDVASVDAGDDGGIRILRNLSQSLGKNRLRRGGERRGPCLYRLMQSATENGKNGEGAAWKKKIPQGLKPDDNEFDRVLPLEATGLLVDGKRATRGKVGKKVVSRKDIAQGGSITRRKAGQFCWATVAYAENDDAGGKPVCVAPKSVSFRVEAEVNSKIDMRNNRSAQIVRDLFEGRDFF
jgi:hypothetical protein